MCNVRNKKWHVYETRGFLKLRSGKELCYFKSLNGKKEFGSNTCLKGQCQGMGAWVRISVNFDFRPPWTEIKICQKYCKSSQITAIFPWDIKFTARGRRRDIFLLAARVIFAKDTVEWVFCRFASLRGRGVVVGFVLKVAGRGISTSKLTASSCLCSSSSGSVWETAAELLTT